MLIGPGNCIIMGDFVHECSGEVRKLSPDEKHRLKEQREQAQDDFKEHMPELPPCFPYCKGHDGKRDGQFNLPYQQQCQSSNNGDHKSDYNYEFSPCFPFCDTRPGKSFPPCFPFCNRLQKFGKAVYSPCRTCNGA
ncbi:hypothetical protein M3Y97_00972700 [Aphelenchoides bicaudatus]|nr:hypothetical protein M3Y97_00972700 [Aphelenchoides bicaudatus]